MTINSTNSNYYITIISTIKSKIDFVIEYCKKTYNKLMLNENKLEFFEIINNSLNEISKILKEHENLYLNEYECFIQIKTYILYIVGQNCKIKNFGHIDEIKYLLNIFKDLINAKFEYLRNKTSLETYNEKLKSYPIKIREFRDYFNENILIVTDEFDDDIDRLNYALRDD